MKRALLLAGVAAALVAGVSAAIAQQPAAPAAGSPTAAQADAFVAHAEHDLATESVVANQAAWINATYITDDTDALNARIGAEQTEMQVRFALEAARFARAPGLSPDTRRKLDLLRNQIVMPAPTRAGAATELTSIMTRMASSYGRGHGTRAGQPINGSDIEAAMGTERDPARLREMWISWHDNVGAPMRQDYARSVALANEGARQLGYPDTGALWRSGYDMSPAEFEAMTDRLWHEVEPLYRSLHAYVRMKLNQRYGAAVQPATGPIRADLLGNMWGQEWGNIYDLVAPPGAGDVGYDTGQLLTQAHYDPTRMVRQAEAFYSSLGFQPLPATFWTRSQITQPRDRDVICHASAWDIDNQNDIRVKTCLRVNADDFVTIHHELGHNYYQRAYNQQPFLYQNGANDGFHEAIGDFVALSITPNYLVQIGLLQPAQVPGPDRDTGLLLRQAMDKVAFLPFGLLIDRWRWGVFSGQITPDHYESAWNDLRLRYQGVVPPVARDETRFDPGAKYHVPAGVPYTRYFLARLLQFQFYQAACRQAGWHGPLHRCSFYGNRAVGERLNRMLAMGQSRPWPEALQVFTGSREISGAAMMEYFAPLKRWLDAQNQGHPTGW